MVISRTRKPFGHNELHLFAFDFESVRTSSATLLLALLSLSCAVGTDPGECTDPECLPAQYALHALIWNLGDTSLLSTGYQVFGQLLRPGDRVDPDDPHDQILPEQVWLNGTDITSLFTEQDGTQPDMRLDTLLAPPGEFNTWIVFSDRLPSLRDSIRTLPSGLRIISLFEDERYRISDGVNVVLEGMVTPDAPCSITLEQIGVEQKVPSIIDTVVSTATEPVFFSEGVLRKHGFTTGRLLVRVQQQRSERREITQGIRSLLTFSNLHLVIVELEG